MSCASQLSPFLVYSFFIFHIGNQAFVTWALHSGGSYRNVGTGSGLKHVSGAEIGAERPKIGWSGAESGVGGRGAESGAERSGERSGAGGRGSESGAERSGAGGRGVGGRGAEGRGAESGGNRNRLESGAAFSPLTLRSHALIGTAACGNGQTGKLVLCNTLN